MKRKLSSALAAVLLLSLIGCSGIKTSEPISETGIFFDTVINIKIYDSNDNDLLLHSFDMCKEYEDKFSRTIDSSEISQINNAAGSPVKVSDDTIDLIQKGLYYCELSGGAFDITIAPVSELWDFQNNSKTVPEQSAIDEAVSHVDYHGVIIDGNTVTLSDPKASIDLGGIAKGFIADRLKAYLESKGVEHAIIDLGGNVLTIGEKADGTDYNIGIQKPFSKRNEAITTVSIKDRSVVSSGVYERYFKVGETLYHHILNPKTGYPYDNGLLGVTIISNDSVDGDGLSTTCFALGLEKGMELIKSLEHIDAIFITDDYQLHDSRN